MIKTVFFCDEFVRVTFLKGFSLVSQLSLDQLSQSIFCIDRYIVDPKKGTICVGGQQFTIEPKAMSVLLVLAASPGEVIDQETIFSQVWPTSIFSPGSIRRCIGILRKILGDSSNDLIITHPKKGYRLNAKVSVVSKASAPVKIRLAIAASILLLLAIVFSFGSPSQHTEQFDIVEMVPITATQSDDFNPQFSPTGDKIAFIRIGAAQQRQLWISELASQQEYQLSHIAGHISQYSWSPDGRSIIFSAYNDGKKQLWSINLTESRLAKKIVDLSQREPISSMHMGQGNRLYYLTKQGNAINLIALNIVTRQQTLIATFNDSFKPYEISLNSSHIALIGFDAQGHSLLKQLDLKSFSQSTIAQLNANRYFIDWHPSQTLLLISDGRLLSTVDSTGKQSALNFENFDFIAHPQFTPSGDGILLGRAILDIDIHSYPLEQGLPSQALINSNTVDRGAALSPDGKKLAFISHRKGYGQLYLYDMTSKKTQLIYANSEKLLGLSQPIWHPNSQQIAAANYEFPILISIKPAGVSSEKLTKPLGVPLSWYQQQNALLTQSYRNNSYDRLNLDDHTSDWLAKSAGNNAVIDQQDQLLFVTKASLKQLSNDQSSAIFDPDSGFELLNAIKQSSYLYIAMSKKQQTVILRLSLESGELSNVTQLPNEIQRLSAVTNDAVLVELAASHKDIVLLTFAQ